VIDELAGILQMDPGPFTLRQLCRMSMAHRRQLWDHTAEILSIQAEINRDRKKRRRPFRASEFHPFPRHRNNREPLRGRGGIPVTGDTIGMLAEAIVGRPLEDQ